MMLSQEEAVGFIQNVLRVPNVLAQAITRPLNLVRDITKAFHLLVPFQNISLLSQPAGTQRIPTLEEIKEDVLTLKGGLCYTNNVFMHHLLAVLGYDVEFLAATCNPKHPANHIMNVCYCGERRESLIVDVGCGYPTYEPIPFNGEFLQTPVYTSSFLKFTFRRSPAEDNLVLRLHAPLCNIGSAPDETWSQFYHFSLIPRKLDFFIPSMSEVYEDRFLKKFRLVLFDEVGMRAIKETPNGAIFIDVRDGNWKETPISDEVELIRRVKSMAPVFDDSTVINAIDNWKRLKL